MQTSEQIEVGSTLFDIYALAYGDSEWGWNIDYDDHGLIEQHEYERFYPCANEAFRAGKAYFQTHQQDIEEEAVTRKKKMADGTYRKYMGYN